MISASAAPPLPVTPYAPFSRCDRTITDTSLLLCRRLLTSLNAVSVYSTAVPESWRENAISLDAVRRALVDSASRNLPF